MTYSYILNNTKIQSIAWLIDSFKKHTALIRESRQQGDYFYYDTFDWSLYRQNYCLYFLNQKFYLYNFVNNIIELEEDYQKKAGVIIKQVSGKLYHKIDPIIDVRALIRVAVIQRTCQSFRILNVDEKTIGRLYLEQKKIKDKNRFKSINPDIEIRPVRGYTKEIKALLNKIPLKQPAAKGEHILARGLKVLNRFPGDYSSKFMIELAPQETVQEALKKIYLNLLTTLRKNEDGIIKDIDIEFLHDFRVSVRRTRSALGQIKGILNERALQKAKNDFKYLGTATNKLRDLDVYLLKEEHYKEMLPIPLREYLNPFFDDLRTQRNAEHQTFVKILKSANYKRMIKEWQNFLSEEFLNIALSNKKEELIIDRVRTVIWKRNRKVLEFGKNVFISASDELLHQLRIEGKKLRYLLEFFSSLFPAVKMQFLIKKLKRLQDNLGEFNDLVLQQKRLKDAAQNISVKSKNNKETILSIGILIGKLNERQESVKDEFAKIFRMFSSKEVQKIYHELFYLPGKGN